MGDVLRLGRGTDDAFIMVSSGSVISAWRLVWGLYIAVQWSGAKALRMAFLGS